MKMYVGITDYDWYSILRNENCDEVNFWKPSGNINFRALETNELFLFKLHSPNNYIVGGGFFVKYSILPTYLAWDAFGIKNGAKTLQELNERVIKYKSKKLIVDNNHNIGCIILTEPFFFNEKDWISVPADWKRGIQTGKTYSTDTFVGKRLLQQVNEKLKNQTLISANKSYEQDSFERYGKEQIVKPRLGQGAFRVLVTDAYNRKCSVTGEKTLPVLDAAHIKPFSSNGPNTTNNGLLLRTDIHKLFDKGYITVNDEYKVEVSKRLNEDYGNGKIYYDFHGKKLLNIPENKNDIPAKEFLYWHNNNVYLG